MPPSLRAKRHRRRARRLAFALVGTGLHGLVLGWLLARLSRRLVHLVWQRLRLDLPEAA